jgi:glycosyltransferase involved in cell wall biosynthesis
MIPERFPELFHEPLYAQLRQQKRACALAADAILCISEATCEDVLAFYGVDPRRVRIVPLAHSATFRPIAEGEVPSPPPSARPFLLYVGERHHYKNFMGLLKAYGTWPMRREIDLVVVGRRWSRAERGEVAQRGLAGQVHLLTGVDDARLRWLYHQAAAFVYPSLYEGFGIPLLEALACGCPVVAARIPPTVEVAGECPFYFDLIGPESLCAALDAALAGGRDPERTRRGLDQARRYSWDRAARQTLDIYAALCA